MARNEPIEEAWLPFFVSGSRLDLNILWNYVR